MSDESRARTVFNRTVKPVYASVRDGVNRFLEQRSNIRTMGTIQLEDLGISGDNRNHYKPSEWMTLRRILPPGEVTPDDVFIDVGSGMGRVVFQAATRYPFRRVIGVELSEQLNDVARENLERNRQRLLCREFEVVTADALEYEFPVDVTVVYFANPFTGPVFQRVVERLLASIDRHPRRVRVIYRNPVEHDYLMSTGRFRPTRRLHGMRPTRAWSVSNSTQMYEVTS